MAATVSLLNYGDMGQWDASVEKWKRRAFEHTLRDIRGVLASGEKGVKKRTGKLTRSLRRESHLIADGFEIGASGTGAPWELGFTRKEYDIIPREAKALKFEWRGDTWILKRVHIPRQTFARRSFIESTMKENIPYYEMSLRRDLDEALKKAFPDITVSISFGI